MILKAGTYRFNGVLTFTNTELITANINGYLGNLDTYYYYFDSISMGYVEELGSTIIINANSSNITGTPELPSSIAVYMGQWNLTDIQNVTILEDIETTDDFGNSFIDSTNYNEVNTPSYLATIEYNGQTIAQLNAGETCTLKCAGLPMETDIIIKINEVN
jgi:hypothetical protein